MTTRTADCVRLAELEQGAVWSVQLARPMANILDAAMIDALADVFRRAADAPALKAVVLAGQGDHFSFGASVEEHQPERVGAMLTSFHGLFGTMLDAAVPVLAAVRGQCLGGGLELAAFCQRVVAAPGAKLGQPEIALGVFAPVASALLAHRLGQARADDLCLTGRVVGAEEALSLGLVDQLADDPEAAALSWIEQHLLPRSASSLRFATRAARLGFRRRFERDLDDLTHLYLDELMLSRDACEGIQAFLEKRAPVWSDA